MLASKKENKKYRNKKKIKKNKIKEGMLKIKNGKLYWGEIVTVKYKKATRESSVKIRNERGLFLLLTILV